MFDRWTRRTTTPRPTARLRAEALEDRWVPATLFVDTTPHPGEFTSIQAAVNAAHKGDTIAVFPGTYTEQVTVPDSKDRITLTAVEPGTAVVKAPATLTATDGLIQIDGADDVTVRGFKLTGPGNLFAGVWVYAKGSAVIENNTITSIRQDPLSGVQAGIGVVLGRGGTPGDAVIAGNTFTGYQKEGITVAYKGSDATIVGNTITGAGPTAVNAQNGIDVNTGADAYVAGNTVTGNVYTVDNTAVGILAFDAGKVTAFGNRVTGNSIGIDAQFTDGVALLLNDVRGSLASGIDLNSLKNATVAGNAVRDSGGDGIVLRAVTNSLVSANLVLDSGKDGIALTDGSSKNDVEFNAVSGSGGFDLSDDTTGNGTAGTANTWAFNAHQTASPPGLK
jgi:parallel beta-helix repeat protein